MNVKYKKYIDYIVNDIQLPYLKSLDQYGLKQGEVVMVLSKLYDQQVTIKGNSVYDSNGNIIYIETSDGNWGKIEYNTNGNLIYIETSDGNWEKKEYDINNNLIYYETSNGYIEDNRR
jgi:uncharacterized protein YuzE